MLEVQKVLADLVSFNTIRDKENKEIMNYIENTLKSIGFKTEKRDKYLIMYNKSEVSLGFVGHTDVVEFAEGWQYDQFNLTKVGNKLYGLGVCDMKAGIAGMISAISEIDFSKKTKGMKLYFTYDEEINFSGIKEVVDYEKAFPNTIIIGEPTDNEFIVGSKGLMEYKIILSGIQSHSSRPDRGDNAILKAISFINDLNEFYEKEIKIKTNDNFEMPYTTMNIGKISGGTVINSVADNCEFLIDFRTIDENDEENIIKEINLLKNKYGAKIQELNKLSPFLNETNLSNKTCSFITEASFLENERIILGAGPVTAHEINEYITIQSLDKLVKQYKELIEKYC